MKSINHRNFCLNKKEVWDVRRKIYHTQGEGYLLFKGFLEKKFTDHLVNYWCRLLDPPQTHLLFPGKEHAFYPGCPCYYKHGRTTGLKVFYNPLWGNQHEVVSNEIAVSIIHLRSQIEGKAFTREISPRPGQRCVVPRLIITRNGENVLAPHSDYGLDEPNPRNIDLARVQATLFLSQIDQDYSGSGFVFTKNNGDKIHCERELGIEPGDLLIWRYNNVHEISDISSGENQVGFVRMLFPPEEISHKAGSISLIEKTKYLLRSMKRKLV